MKLLWESEWWPGARLEPGVSHLAWIPQPDKPGHGLLGVGSESGAVGITLTHAHPTEDDNARYNFNLRGHHSGIVSVAWNTAQSKLASCDTSGVIYVWVRNDDRWSVELVNDRGVKVRDLSWSPCGSSALICYEDNFVLIGSATGQRVWSHSFPAANPCTAGTWTADSRHLVLAFQTGLIQVLSEQGATMTERTLCPDSIRRLACSPTPTRSADEPWTLAVLSAINKIYMISDFDQVFPHVYQSSCEVLQMTWNHDGSLLALINTDFEIVILDTEARVVHRETVALSRQGKPLSALTWAHHGSSLVVAAGGSLAVARVLPGVPRLFQLVSYKLWRQLGCDSKKVDRLPLPVREKSSLRAFDHHIIRCRIPREEDLCAYVCGVVEPRCYCTIRPLARAAHSYVLCMEHMGGLVPLLIGRQVNRFLPQFHISLHPSSSQESPSAAGASAQVEDASVPPRASTGRHSLWRRSKRHIRALMSRHVRPVRTNDTRLVHVASNVWCTRFNISSMSSEHLPPYLAQVIYKTSVLHLQPRQMTIQLADLTDSKDDESSASESTSEATSVCSSCDETSQLIERAPGSHRVSDDGLTREERAFFDKVLSECASLRQAMDAGVAREREREREARDRGASTPLTHTSAADNVGGAWSLLTSASASPLPLRCGELREGRRSVEPSMGGASASTASWQEEVDSLEFIDRDDGEALLLPCSSNGQRGGEGGGGEEGGGGGGGRRREQDDDEESTRPPTSSFSSHAEDALTHQGDIKAHLDKLARIAAQLSHRHADFNAKRDRASIGKMRAQMKELLRRVDEIEKKVGSGDVRGEVRQLMRTLEHMKKALGEAEPPRPRGARVLTMHNKTPFWNEHNQVYQLDFGGRVTQESAKNFQIEVDGRQVLQFGRIEGGAYTLDFRKPFCASQAFAVALASITQRLK